MIYGSPMLMTVAGLCRCHQELNPVDGSVRCILLTRQGCESIFTSQRQHGHPSYKQYIPVRLFCCRVSVLVSADYPDPRPAVLPFPCRGHYSSHIKQLHTCDQGCQTRFFCGPPELCCSTTTVLCERTLSLNSHMFAIYYLYL